MSINQKGMTLIEILVSAGILALTIGGVAIVVAHVMKTNRQIANYRTALSDKYLILKASQSPTIWQHSTSQTMAKQLPGSQELSQCFNSPTGCSAPADPNTWYDITLFDENDLQLDTLSPDYSYKVQWRPSCQYGGSCKKPIIHMRANVEKKDLNMIQTASNMINTSQFEIQSVTGFAFNTFANFCQSLGGKIVNQECRFSFAGKTCAAGEIVVSINPFQCRKAVIEPLSGCRADPINTVRVTSVDVNGNAICAQAY